ncbi:DUF1080 domain-containing protein [Rubripirellula amarantea]|uniref:3-keto-alpha-glucoside-1,2-lyase/3-keto-2-hydroxy-glucal hydratase domain-containing protein n=2 Tax=Rubripirellula amarantea TaxID=2527999 RepID=A0A5C5WSF6_9BACT|nr:DUF1080 domain-containing protein [Rubripirellula amarantea]TWT53089.1 hypothetical protein Pla22_07170 [Rubripirellula amarantea]
MVPKANSDVRLRVPAFMFTSMLSIVVLLVFSGCRKSTPTVEVASESPEDAATAVVTTTKAYEVSADQLLASRLPRDRASEGWIRLFDGYTMFGWEIIGKANWEVKDETIVVSGGESSLLCTSMPWQDFELQLQYQSAADADSGVLVRTPIDPNNPSEDCYEINLADGDSDYPTGSLNGRQKSDLSGGELSDGWRTLSIRADQATVTVTIDDVEVCRYEDPSPLPGGRIGLQYLTGETKFRDIQLRPLGLESLLDESLSQWTTYPDMPGSFSMTDDGEMHVEGGRTQLETKESYDDFVLLAEYRLAEPEMNSGIFFRCIPGDEMMGYECQLSNQIKDANPLTPADHGTGGFFKRQEARIVAGNPEGYSSVVLLAKGPMMAAWVEGIQVSNWFDDRKPDENPRRGLRTKAGTIMIQGHDPTTDAWIRQLKVANLK